MFCVPHAETASAVAAAATAAQSGFGRNTGAHISDPPGRTEAPHGETALAPAVAGDGQFSANDSRTAVHIGGD